MQNQKKFLKMASVSLAVLMTVMLGAAVAQSGEEDERRSIVKLDVLHIKDDILAGDCASNLEGYFGARDFLKGVCLYFNTQKKDHLSDSIETLQLAQNKGLDAIKQSAATLIEGNAHCALAQKVLDEANDKLSENLYLRDQFCFRRNLAAGSYADITWGAMQVQFTSSDANKSLETLVGDMGECYQGVLDFKYDSDCGMVTPLTDSELEGIAQKSLGIDNQSGQRKLVQGGLMASYFVGSTSPIGGMFSRKISQTKAAVEGSLEAINDLKTKVGTINGDFNTLKSAFDNDVKPVADQAVIEYKEAIREGYKILDAYDLWQKGLLEPGAASQLAARRSIVDEDINKKFIEPQFVDKSLVEKAASVPASFGKLLKSKETAASLTKSLCQIYFCEVVSKKRISVAIEVCQDSDLANNPLCVNDNGEIANGKLVAKDANGNITDSKNVGEFCKAAGLAPEYAVAKLENVKLASCQADFPVFN